ncbi:MAG: V-type ATP synthase subunit A [Pseudomonadota bacterium]
MSHATLRWISGPVLRATVDGPFTLREAVRIGPQRLLGEVVSLDRDDILVQVYEDTAGLRPGSGIEGDGLPLSIPLGPGLLGNIFDGLLRPLSGQDTAFVRPGFKSAEAVHLRFVPQLVPGMPIRGGEVLGEVHTANGLMQRCLVPPETRGEVIKVWPEDTYSETDCVCLVQSGQGEPQGLTMRHSWPVRVPRPIRRRLPALAPLVTGQRILDSLFPIAQGGKGAIPGGFGTGKTVLLEALAKGCNADVIVYLGCGERGNEMAGVLDEFPRLTHPRTGRPLMERTVIIANTSNMPVAAREASIYSAITVAEYFRDQGLHAALMADSTSRWAEALREVSGRFGELPGEGGYPAYLSSRLAQFYERAALVETLNGTTGSVTVMGAISPPSGDFSEPVTSHSKRYVRSFWALDARRAQARFYPAINPLQSYAEDARQFEPWWQQQGNPQWLSLRRRFLTLLEEQSKLERMARIIGKDALPMRQQLTLICADLVNEAFLRQSAFSEVDWVATPARQSLMMRLIGHFIELSEQALAAGVGPDRIVRLDCMRALQRMAEEIGNDELQRFVELEAQVEQEFAQFVGKGEAGDVSARVG